MVDTILAKLKTLASGSGSASIDVSNKDAKEIISFYKDFNSVVNVLNDAKYQSSEETLKKIKDIMNKYLTYDGFIFQRRTCAPEHDNPYYYSNKNPFYRDGYGMPNCTCYADGRFAELTNTWLPCLGNAEDWIAVAESKGYMISKVPYLGAVACWRVGKVKNGSDGAGHVAIVEEIKSNADIITSNSAWKGTEWYEQTLYYSKGYNWTSSSSGKKYEFQGFIVPAIVFIENPCSMTIKGSLNLRTGPGTSNSVICTMKKNEIFYTDGQYMVVDGSKWMHGYYKLKNVSGWASSKYLEKK